MKRLEMIKEKLICALECEMSHLDSANTEEMGEVMDMIKDIEEACYYHTVVEAMKEDGDKEEIEEQLARYTPYQKRYYTPYPMRRRNPDYWDTPDGYRDVDRRWTREEDNKSGRSYEARRTYMEAKEMHKNQDEQLKHLEEYMKELSTDITDMIKDSTPQEKVMLKQKLTTLISMING